MTKKNLVPIAKRSDFRTGKNTVCDQPFDRDKNLATVRTRIRCKIGVTKHQPSLQAEKFCTGFQSSFSTLLQKSTWRKLLNPHRRREGAGGGCTLRPRRGQRHWCATTRSGRGGRNGAWSSRLKRRCSCRLQCFDGDVFFMQLKSYMHTDRKLTGGTKRHF